MGGLQQAKQNAGKTVDVASLNEEIQLFHVNKGRFPNSLDELVQEGYIKKVPDAPYGMKIDYNPDSGDVKVVNQ
jgi:competence protein ComGC